MVTRSHLVPQSVARLQASARSPIRAYVASRKRLAALGILRSERSLQSDYAEWFASKILHLKLARSAVEPGWDAKDRCARTYQVKSRVVPGLPATTAFHFSRPLPRFDFLVCVFFTRRLELLALVVVPRNVVADLARDDKQGLRFRWNQAAAGDPRILRVIWPSLRART